MARDTLYWFRLITPGALAALLLLSLFNPSGDVHYLSETYKEWEGLGVALCVLLGFLYSVYDVRRMLLADFWVSVNQSVEDHLLGILRRERSVTADEEQYLRKERRLMDTFYRIVDSDESLKARTGGVYLNGYLTTLGVDIITIGSISFVLHTLLWEFSDNIGHLRWSIASAEAVLVAWLTYRRSITRHKKLSGEQLRFIGNFYADKVRQYTDAILRNMPAK